MDINLLALDVGHSRVKLGVFKGGELLYTNRVALEPAENLAGAIAEAWRQFGGDSAEVAAAASNRAAIDPIEKLVRDACKTSPQWVGQQLDLPVPVKTKIPEKTGVDRVLNIAAAYQQLGKACCVVDVGSAVTVDFSDDSGAFVGGVIAPGARAQAEALHVVAPRLPVVQVRGTEEAIGDDTESAINAGIVNGIRGLVRHVVEQHALTMNTWPEIIATGGDAAELLGGWELIHAVSPDLTLFGIALAYTEHHIKYGT